MAADRDVLLSSRNGFLVVILALLAVAVVQIVRDGAASPAIVATWVAGVVAFYGSKWYYGRQE